MHSVCLTISDIPSCVLQIKLCKCHDTVWAQEHRAYSLLTFVLLIETWGENSIFLLLHVELLRMWAKTSHMQAAFISFYIKCFWFMSPQCLFPAWNKLWRWIPKRRERERQRETTTERTGRKRLGKSSNQSQSDLPSLECVSALQVMNMWVKKKSRDSSAV